MGSNTHIAAPVRRSTDIQDYPGAVWHHTARLADDLIAYAVWMTDNGIDLSNPVEAARLCVDRWDGLDLDAICKTLAEARKAVGLLIGRDDG